MHTEQLNKPCTAGINCDIIIVMDIKQLSEKLKHAGVVKVSKEELFDTITEMAKSIHACPVRNSSNRPYEMVFNHCSFIAIEYALVKVIGGERNPKKFNVRDKDSYNWDVKCEDKSFEVKRHKTGSKWFTYTGKSIKTYLKNCLNLDYLVTAYVDTTTTDYLIDFALIADSKTFEFYFQPSKYSNSYYYDHVMASKLGHCVVLNLRNPQKY